MTVKNIEQEIKKFEVKRYEDESTLNYPRQRNARAGGSSISFDYTQVLCVASIVDCIVVPTMAKQIRLNIFVIASFSTPSAPLRAKGFVSSEIQG